MVTNGGEGQHRGREVQTIERKVGSRMYSVTWGIKKRDISVNRLTQYPIKWFSTVPRQLSRE